MSLESLIPDVDIVLALPAEELAYYVLMAARHSMTQGMFHQQSVMQAPGGGLVSRTGYPASRLPEIEVAVSEAWQWLENQLLLVPAAGTNGLNGWRVLGRRAKGLNTEPAFRAFRQGVAFPRELLHPGIADRVWIDIMRSDYDSAVFLAFKQVEVAVREAGGFQAEDVGVVLMRKAFDPDTGPLTRDSDPASERLALAHLFAGAIGSYKNPHSHRHVQITEQAEAQEMVMLASHLLRIVDSRRH